MEWRGDEAVRQPGKRWSFGLASAGVVVVLALATAVTLPRLKSKSWFSGGQSPLEGLDTAVVQRADLSVTLTSGGRIDSSERTKIECELERLDVSVKGQGSSGGGASTILSVIPDGTKVKKGDILCELDSSEYVEMLRQQRMTVTRSLSDHRQAELDLEVARMAVDEFKKGTLVESLKELAGVVALGEASQERMSDRLTWARRMLEKGYIPVSQLSTEEFNERKAALQLEKSRLDHDVFQRFTVPRVLKSLEAAVYKAEVLMNVQIQRLKRNIERQEMLERQVENCTMRAPHDGLVIYFYDHERQVRIEEGTVVRQHQDMFYLPNLKKMQAMALVHESVAKNVKPGMPAVVRVEGLPGQVLKGHVKSIAQLPTTNSFNEVRYFYTEVTLDTLPEGLLPGMTAQVEIATETRLDVLSIPTEALGYEAGREICYVAHDDQVERREIKVGQATRGLFEVVEGLAEGERVVLNPAQFDTELETISPFNPDVESRWNGADAE